MKNIRTDRTDETSDRTGPKIIKCSKFRRYGPYGYFSFLWKFGMNPLFFQFIEILVRTTYRTEKKSVPKSVPRTVPGSSPDQNPYHVPDHEISDQKSVPRTKFRTGSDFWFGTAVHGQVGQIKQPFDM